MKRPERTWRESYIAPRFSRYRLRVDSSSIHQKGVFAAESIPAAKKVIEYTGQLLTWAQAIKLERTLEKRGAPKNDYLAQLNRNWIINGAVRGSGAELINHSCQPNLSPRRIGGHLFYFSRRRIRQGEELAGEYGVCQHARVRAYR